MSAVNGTADLHELPLGLEFRLASGWKIYWRTPGEAGMPPTLELKLASGDPITNDIQWPLPQRFDAFGFDNFGYANNVILPVKVRGIQKVGLSMLLARWKHLLVLIFACRLTVRSAYQLAMVSDSITVYDGIALHVKILVAAVHRSFRFNRFGKGGTIYKSSLLKTALIFKRYLLKVSRNYLQKTENF